jgi:hypothetical protein
MSFRSFVVRACETMGWLDFVDDSILQAYLERHAPRTSGLRLMPPYGWVAALSGVVGLGGLVYTFGQTVEAPDEYAPLTPPAIGNDSTPSVAPAIGIDSAPKVHEQMQREAVPKREAKAPLRPERLPSDLESPLSSIGDIEDCYVACRKLCRTDFWERHDQRLCTDANVSENVSCHCCVGDCVR